MSRTLPGLARTGAAFGVAPLMTGFSAAATAWYACYTKARSEKKAHALLEQRGIESFLPVVPLLRKWSDRTKRIEAPLFPGYVFARSPATSLGQVVSTPGVVAIVRFGSRPVPIPDEEIHNIVQFAQVLATTDIRPPRVRLREGQRVRIVSGPFEGVYGVVREVRGRARVLVGLTSIGIGFEVDLSVDSVRPLARA